MRGLSFAAMPMRPARIALGVALAGVVAVGASSSTAFAAGSITDAPIRTIEAGQGTIGYRSVGTGRPLVLVMGLGGSMDAWPPSVIDALAADRRVIVFDNEGIRDSTLGSGALTIPRMAGDTASLIRRLGLRRADVLGWSLGGMVAQSLARTHPRWCAA